MRVGERRDAELLRGAVRGSALAVVAVAPIYVVVPALRTWLFAFTFAAVAGALAYLLLRRSARALAFGR